MTFDVYSMGFSNRTWDDTIVLLQKFEIHRLVDIRTLPGSKHTPQFNQEHLQQAVVPHELQRDLPAFPRELLTAVTIVLDQPLRGEPHDHLADRGRGDAQTLGKITGRDGALVAVQLVEGLEIVLLAAREGTPNWSYWTAYHNL